MIKYVRLTLNVSGTVLAGNISRAVSLVSSLQAQQSLVMSSSRRSHPGTAVSESAQPLQPLRVTGVVTDTPSGLDAAKSYVHGLGFAKGVESACSILDDNAYNKFQSAISYFDQRK